MLKQKINADYITAFKEKNTVAKNLLSVIKGEIQMTEKNTKIENLPDREVIKILNKTVKSLKESQALSPSAQLAEELFIVESYLPTQMTEEEIAAKINELKAEGAGNVAEIMRAFADLPADRKLVAQIFNSQK